MQEKLAELAYKEAAKLVEGWFSSTSKNLDPEK